MGSKVTLGRAATDKPAGRATFRLRFEGGSTSEPREAAIVDVDRFVQTLVEELVWDTPDGTPPLDVLLIETSEATPAEIPFGWPQAGVPGGKIHVAPRSVYWPRIRPVVSTEPDPERDARVRGGMGLGLVHRVGIAVAVASGRSPGARAVTVAALGEVATVLRAGYDDARGWGLALPDYRGCSDGCVPCIVDWIREQIKAAS